ncbi:MAG: class I SAM-dependent methyltransferase [Nitrosotalea sp.]
MSIPEQLRIKSKILSINPQKWWGNDFDVRFYLISKLQNLENKKILDIGGGIGIVSSEIRKDNFRVNLDLDCKDLETCVKVTDPDVGGICSSMTDMPFLDNSFDVVISSSVLQYAKLEDMKSKQMTIINGIQTYPNVEKSLKEIYRILKPKGHLYLVTQNNSYYNSYMLDYNELQYATRMYFTDTKITFYNTYPRISKIRKFNMANIIPKILGRLIGPDNVVKKLSRDKSTHNHSLSFFVEATKQEK